jgi:hypothetical protein
MAGLDFTNYFKHLKAFYEEVAWWNYYKKINNTDGEEKHLKAMKEKAKILKKEISLMPSDLQSSDILAHVNKALSL